MKKITNRYENDPGLGWWALGGSLGDYRDHCRDKNINLERLGHETVGDIIEYQNDSLAQAIEKFYLDNLGGMRVRLRGEIATKEWHDTIKQYYKDHKDLHGQSSALDTVEFLEWLIKIGRDRKISKVMEELRVKSG